MSMLANILELGQTYDLVGLPLLYFSIENWTLYKEHSVPRRTMPYIRTLNSLLSTPFPTVASFYSHNRHVQ